jgi:hypothetical protein
MKKFFQELAAFYPDYLKAHDNKANRVLHFIGATGFFVLLFFSFAISNYWLLPGAILIGYVLPGIGHRFFQHNDSFRSTKPLLCVLCAFRMYLETFTLLFKK